MSAEDLALWESVAAQVAPLDNWDIAVPEPELPAPAAGVGTPKQKPAARRKPPPAATKPKPPPPPPSRSLTIDRRTLQGLRRGRTPIDARLDLHGHRQASAYAALAAFLQGAARSGRRFVLVITGKGAPPGAGGRDEDGDLPIPERRGVLRSAVPHWLREPALADLVVGVAAAGPLHGGSGALYIQLRRKGPGSRPGKAGSPS
ncbi:Smr/MutS family protein [Marinibaculum pumilum]|uniref:Smr/MutS family protein n=1 Tax=Marinibaculum pumilum TaxID=1766165 RepID=A0ABV7L5S7_9PROT